MIILAQNKINKKFNINDDGIIMDLNGNVQDMQLKKGRYFFKGYAVHKIQMYTKFGWRDGRTWAIHHKDENKLNNNINNLEYLKQSEHSRLHNIGKKHPHSEETKQKISNSMKGRSIHGNSGFHKGNIPWNKGQVCPQCGVNKGNIPWNKGKKGVQIYSEETKKKLSLALKGKHWKLDENTGKRIYY